MLAQTHKSCIPADVDIEATLHPYLYEDYQVVPMTINNVTTRTISISPKVVICEVEPVEIADTGPGYDCPAPTLPKLDQILSKIQLPDDITAEDSQACRDLISSYQDIFSTGDTDIGTTDKVKHRIELTDETPFKQKYRRIPPASIDEV